MRYISKLSKTGAVRKTPSRVIDTILSQIERKPQLNVIELGAGKGEVTHRIIDKQQNAGITYYAFELDGVLAGILEQSSPKIKVLKENAFEFRKNIPENFQADYIICSIPISFYKRAQLAELLSQFRQTLKEDGKLFIIYHAFWLTGFIKKYLPGVRFRMFLTLPPYFLISTDK